jgi:hypothetical protein
MSTDIVARVHTLFAVEVYTDAMGASALVGGVTGQDLATATECRHSPSSGEAFPQHLAIYAQKPVANFSTMALAQALDAIGLTGLKIASTTNPGVRFYAQQYAEGSTPASGSVHRRYTLREGILVPRRLSVSHQGDATLEYSALITWDGTNDPIVVNDSVALPSGLADDERFTLGPIRIGDEVFEQATSFELDFGLDARTTGAQSAIWDSHSSIRSVTPRLMITGIDVEWFKSTRIPLQGRKGTHADTAIYLRKRDGDGATFVANDDNVHIKLTGDGLCYAEQVFGASHGEDGTVSLAMPLRFDGTNAPLVIDTTSTHP